MLDLITSLSREFVYVVHPFVFALTKRPPGGVMARSTIAKKTSRTTALMALSQWINRSAAFIGEGTPHSNFALFSDVVIYLCLFKLGCLLGHLAQLALCTWETPGVWTKFMGACEWEEATQAGKEWLEGLSGQEWIDAVLKAPMDEFLEQRQHLSLHRA